MKYRVLPGRYPVNKVLFSIGREAGVEDKLQHSRRELEEKYHNLTKPFIHRVSFEYCVTLFTICVVLSDGGNAKFCVMIEILELIGGIDFSHQNYNEVLNVFQLS